MSLQSLNGIFAYAVTGAFFFCFLPAFSQVFPKKTRPQGKSNPDPDPHS